MTELPFKIKKAEVPGPHFSSYLLSPNENATEICLLLHGYAESGIYFYEKLKEYLPSNAKIISPDGPFHLPVMTKKGYRMGHSWYFYDGATDEYVIDMSIATEYILNIFETENPKNLPVRIIGYSQGGYFAPFAGLRLKNVIQVIGMNSQFLDDELTSKPTFKMHALNGEKDEIVDYTKSQKSMRNLKEQGLHADFELISDGSHKVGPDFLEKLSKLLKL